MKAGDDAVVEENTEGAVIEEHKDDEMSVLSNVSKKNVAHLLLKFESRFNVPQRCIDELVEENSLYFFISFRSHFKRYFTVVLKQTIVRLMI